MSETRRPLGQLDVPLVWEVGPAPKPQSAPDDPFAVPEERPPVGGVRLLAAALADVGVGLAALVVAWGLAAGRGSDLTSGQILVAAGVGVEILLVVVVSALAGWRGTPGMLLVDAAFAEAVPVARATRVALLWCLSLVLVGLPLLVGRRGRRPLERLAGSPAMPRPRLAAA